MMHLALSLRGFRSSLPDTFIQGQEPSHNVISHPQEPRGLGVRDLPRGDRVPGGGAAHRRLHQELDQRVCLR